MSACVEGRKDVEEVGMEECGFAGVGGAQHRYRDGHYLRGCFFRWLECAAGVVFGGRREHKGESEKGRGIGRIIK